MIERRQMIMKKILLFSVMAFFLFFCVREKSYAQASLDTTQYFRIVDGVAHPITEQEAESLVNKARISWNYKTNTIYSKASPSTSVAIMSIKYTTVTSGGRPQFDIVGVSNFSPQNNYNAEFVEETVTADIITYRINYSDMLDSGSRTTSFLP